VCQPGETLGIQFEREMRVSADLMLPGMRDGEIEANEMRVAVVNALKPLIEEMPEVEGIKLGN
jgi:hypothetical protein